MINNVVLVGRLARDPFELRRSQQTGTAVISFTLAVDRPFAKEDAQIQADFIPCVVFGKQAETVDLYCRQGTLVGIEGRIQTREYDKNGQRTFVTEVICQSIRLLESKAASEARKSNSPAQQAKSNYQPQPKIEEAPSYDEDPVYEIDEDDLPF